MATIQPSFANAAEFFNSLLGSNVESGADDRDREDDDHQVGGEPVRDTGHGLVLRQSGSFAHPFSAGRGRPNVS
jgi:hypothetical protein